MGGENVSLAVNYSQTAGFHSAGYQDIMVNNSYIGGQVRQYGNFSFSRIYQAGSPISASQPETAFRIFQRAISGLDIATGKTNVEQMPLPNPYSSNGSPTTPQEKQPAPPQPAPTCYILDPTTCSDRAYGEVYLNTGVIHEYILIDKATAHLFPDIRSQGNSTTGGLIGQDTGDDDNRVVREQRLMSNNGSRAGSESGSGSGSTNSGTSSGTKLLRGRGRGPLMMMMTMMMIMGVAGGGAGGLLLQQ